MSFIRDISRGLAASVLALALASVTASADAGSRHLKIVHEDAQGIRLSVTIPEDAVTVGTTVDGSRTVTIDGLDPWLEPGTPQLPSIVVSIAIPEGPEPRYSYQLGPLVGHEGRPVYSAVAETAEIDEALPAEPPHLRVRRDAPWPAQPVSMELLRYRGLRIARLRIHPVIWNAGEERIEITRSIDLQVDFGASRGFARMPPAGPEARIARRGILNHRTLAQVDSRPAPESVAPPKGGLVLPVRPGVKVRVAEEGLYRVTRSQLAGAGFEIDAVDPRNLQVSFRGQPIPCRVTGEDDGVFGSQDELEFYGFPNSRDFPSNSRFSSENVFFIDEMPSPGLRFPTRSAPPGTASVPDVFPETIHFEEGNDIYTLGAPAQVGDPHYYWVWFEDNPNPPRVTTKTHSASLPGLEVTSYPARFRALFFGRTDTIGDPDHSVRLRVNGTVIGETSWNGRTFHTADFPFDGTLFQAGANAFRIDYQEIAFPDAYYLDWIEIEYPRQLRAISNRLRLTSPGGLLRYPVTSFTSAFDPVVLDISNPLAPVEIVDFDVLGSGPFTVSFEESSPAGARYWLAGDSGRLTASGFELDVVSNLRDPANAADLLIIVPDGWEPALADLVAAREAQGLRVVLAGLTDIADEFAGGNVDDVAIRDVIAYAYTHWTPPALAYTMLVGVPNLDPQNWLDRPNHQHQMPTHFTVTSAQGETMSDNWFGSINGDDLPEVGIGRFSRDSANGIGLMIDKVLAYEAQPESRRWFKDVLQVASNDAAFESSLEEAAQFLPDHYTVKSAYRREGATTASISTDIEEGAAMVSFLGHGNVGFWADSGINGPYFGIDDAAALANFTRLPFVVALNCLNGLIGDPFSTTSLAEAFHNSASGGALGMWAPSALGFLGEFDRLQRIFYRTMFTDRVEALGTATSGALVETFLTEPVSINMVREMILLGDPSGRVTVICEPQPDDTCNGVDEDCDDLADDDYVPTVTFCGEGNCQTTGNLQCVNGTLIDDCIPMVESPEVCFDGIDNDCDGEIDESSAEDASDWYADFDGDGFGDPDDHVVACEAPDGYGPDAGDCTDANADAWATPGEINPLTFLSLTTLRWLPPVEPGGVLTMHLLRTTDPADFSTATECIDSIQIGGATAIDATLPPPDTVFYYLARARNGCPVGFGSLGVGSDGQPRTGKFCL